MFVMFCRMASPADVETSEMISARRTESIDAPNISKLATPLTEFLFGRVNVINLMLVEVHFLRH